LIIDFRIQPPFRSFLDIYFYRERPAVPDPVTMTQYELGRVDSASFRERSMDLFLKEMDALGIDIAVVMGQRSGPSWGSVSNDDIGELVRRFPDRFVGFAGVDAHDPRATAEVRRAIEELGCRGISVLPGWSDPPLHDDDPRVFPIYEAALDLGVPVVVTSSHFIGPDMSYAMPEYLQRVALALPELTIIVGHACWPWTAQACALAARCHNVYLMPEFYMYVPGMPGAREYVDAANGFLSHRMLYSSCFPTRSLDQALENFAALPLNEPARDQLQWRNAARLLGLEHLA
jgi:predicted TIM-barrel fold metal-dependent hydrolase